MNICSRCRKQYAECDCPAMETVPISPINVNVDVTTRASNGIQDAIDAAFKELKEPHPIHGTGRDIQSYNNRIREAKWYFEEGVKLGLRLALRKEANE